MVSTEFLTARVTRYYRLKGYVVEREVKLGNSVIDLAATHPRTREKIAVEVKASGDDVVRGVGQLCEALSWSYSQAVLVMGLRDAGNVALKVFQVYGIGVAGIDSRGSITWIIEPR